MSLFFLLFESNVLFTLKLRVNLLMEYLGQFYPTESLLLMFIIFFFSLS